MENQRRIRFDQANSGERTKRYLDIAHPAYSRSRISRTLCVRAARLIGLYRTSIADDGRHARSCSAMSSPERCGIQQQRDRPCVLLGDRQALPPVRGLQHLVALLPDLCLVLDEQERLLARRRRFSHWTVRVRSRGVDQSLNGIPIRALWIFE